MTFAALVVLLAQASAARAAAGPAAVGDGAFARIDYPAAIAAYERAQAGAPDDASLCWRLARAHVCAGEVAEGPDRDSLLRRGEEWGRRAVAADSTVAEGHTWLAAALGYIAYEAGMREQVRLVHEILAETARALELNPRDDAAHSIRGSLFRALGNIGWLKRELAAVFVGDVPAGGFPEGEEALLRAVELAPEVMRHQYELGVLYLDWGKSAEARRALERALALPVRVAIDRPRREKAALLLRTLPAGGG